MRAVVGIVLGLAVVAGVVGVATYSYNLGVAQGFAQSGKLPTLGPGVVPYPVYPYGVPFHAFGFGFFGLLWPVLFVFLLFALMRRLLWRGHAWGGPRGRGAPSWLEEWHRRAHESTGDAGTV
jgi:hypothetical protein